MSTNNTPRVNTLGIKDDSQVQLVPELLSVPQHLPLVFIETLKGPVMPMLCSGGDLTRLYGTETFNARGKYFSHQTVLASEVSRAGNSVLVQRLVPANAETAKVTLAVAKSTVNRAPYDRNADDSVARDTSGNILSTGTAIDMTVLEWCTIPSSEFDFNSATPELTFSVTAPEGQRDVTLYPVATFSAASPGEHGNNVGVRVWPATANDADPADPAVLADNGNAWVYNGQIVERINARSSANIISNLFSGNVTQFTLEGNYFDEGLGVDLSVNNLVDLYSNDGLSTKSSPIFSPIGDAVMHDMTDLMTDIAATEAAINHDVSWGGGSTGLELDHQVNIFTGLDAQGVHLYTVQVESAGDSFVGSPVEPQVTSWLAGREETVWLQDGTDGTVDLSGFDANDRMSRFDALVQSKIMYDFDNPSYPLVDTGKYPFSVVYDTGFAMPAKEAIISILGKRPDVSIALATNQYGYPALDPMGEGSTGATLRATYGLYTESATYGTGVCRVVVMGHMGKLVGSSFKEELPLTVDLAIKRAKYMGAGSGAMRPGQGYDNAPYNQITAFKEISYPWMSNSAKDAVWNAGVNFVQNLDHFTVNHPALQTVYSTKNSVLTSEMVMLIAVDVTKVCANIWRLLSGNTDLTQAQFVDRSNKLFLEMTDGRYDDRVILEPRTYFTAADDARGYSWNMEAIVYGNVSKNVGSTTVTVRRQSQLGGS